MADPTVQRAFNSLDASVREMIDALERDMIRPMQRAAFKCSYDCTNMPTYSADECRKCVEGCNTGIDKAQQHIQSQMQAFQSRLQSSMQMCQAKAQDMMQDGEDGTKVKAAATDCMMTCVQDFLAMVPKVDRRIRTGLSPLMPGSK